MKISAIQTKLRYQYDINRPETLDYELCIQKSNETLNEALEMATIAAKNGSQLIVTIEALNSSISPYDSRYDFRNYAEPLDGKVIDRFSKIARQYKSYIVAGLYTMRNDKFYNSAVMIGPSGNIVEIYDKTHLPLGEGYPIIAGDEYKLVETEHGKIGMLICWDLEFPEPTRKLSEMGAHMIAIPTWGWQNRIVQCRALENSIFLAGAMGIPYSNPLWDFCDPSSIINQYGDILTCGSRDKSEIVTAEVDITKPLPITEGFEQYTQKTNMRDLLLSMRRSDIK